MCVRAREREGGFASERGMFIRVCGRALTCMILARSSLDLMI